MRSSREARRASQPERPSGDRRRRAAFARLTLRLVAALCLATLAAPAVAQQDVAEPDRAQQEGEPRRESAAQSMLPPGGAPSFGECESAVDEATLRQEVFDGARTVMRRAALEVDYAEIVERSWLAARFDQKFERIVDAKIEVLRADRAYFERLLDGNVPSRAEAVAQQTADLVFGSPEFEALSQDLQAEIGKRLQPILADADLDVTSRASDCIQTFLGARYAATVQQAFAADAEALKPTGRIEAGDVGVSAAFNLAGVIAAMLTVVFRRLVRRIVRAIVRRLAGAIAARMAAWVSVIAGAAVLVYELIAGSDGVFPIIRDEMLSVETKQTIQQGLIEELAAAGPEELDKRAQEIAALMFGRWRDFKQNHHAVLTLAERDPRFKAFLEDQPPQRFEALSVVVRRLKETDGDAAVIAAVDHGLLAEALRIETIALDLERWAPRGLTIEDLVAWKRAAGERYADALAARLPEVIGPGDLTPEALEQVLALGPTSARTVAAMAPATRAAALAQPASLLETLSARHNASELDNLFRALGAVPDAARRELYVARAASDPSVSTMLARSGVADSVASSRRPDTAVELLTTRTGAWDPFTMVRHARLVADGEVSPMTLAYRFGWGLAIGLGLPLLLGIGLLRSTLGMLGLRRRR